MLLKINKSLVSPACISESSTSQMPCDIAQGLHQQLAQPVISFPTTEMGSKMIF